MLKLASAGVVLCTQLLALFMLYAPYFPRLMTVHLFTNNSRSDILYRDDNRVKSSLRRLMFLTCLHIQVFCVDSVRDVVRNAPKSATVFFSD